MPSIEGILDRIYQIRQDLHELPPERYRTLVSSAKITHNLRFYVLS